jgi:CrcB protein
VKLTAALAVFAGGGLGAVCRYALSIAFLQRFGPGFPYGTMTINLLGCLLIGVVSQLAVSPLSRTFLSVGVLGGFTTFSAFAFETVVLADERATASALVYVSVSVLGGILAAGAGMWIAHRMLAV